MILDLPPQIEQAIIDTANARGMSIDDLLNEMISDQHDKLAFDMMDKYGLDSDPSPTIINQHDAKLIQELLDNPPPISPAMKRLLALRG